MKDYALLDLPEIIKKDIFKPHTALKTRCCDKTVAYKFSNTCVVIEPCVRVVLGIDPRTYSVLPAPVILISKTIFYCHSCTIRKIPEYLGTFISEIRRNLGNRVIIDMPHFQTGKGCWITVTEFGKDSRFMNFQTDYSDFKRILGQINFMTT
ncbi:MAG: hypothetical protein QMD86_01530 [Patescibacteria group bacterium]|nr:hypothetical protein [Patescibacteria group bacterium]